MPTIELKPLCELNAKLGKPVDVGAGPNGHRMVVDVISVAVSGERIKAELATNDAADWITLSDNGTLGTLDVRMTLKTDDGAIVYVEYCGRIEMTTGIIAVAPTFQTGAAQYSWLNRIQAIGAGVVDFKTSTLKYTFYEAIPSRDA